MVKQTYFYFLSNISSAFIAIFTLPIFTRILTPEDFGILALFILFGSLFSQIVSLSLTEATKNLFFKKEYENFRVLNFTNILTLFLIFLFFGLVIYICSDFISENFFKNQISAKLVLASYIFGCVMYIYNYFNSLLVIREEAKKYLIINLLTIFLSPILAILIIYYTNYTYEGRIISSFVIFCFFLIIMFVVNRNTFRPRFSSQDLERSIKFTIPLVPNTIISQTHEATDKMMTNFYLGLNSLGILSIAIRVADISKLLINSILQSWTPYFLKNARNSEFSKKKIISGYYQIVSTIAISCFLIAIFSEEFVIIFTVEAYYFTIKYIPLICFSIFIIHIFSSVSRMQILHSERTSIFFKISFFSLILNIVLNLFLIPRYGIFGAIIATMISGFIGSLYLFILAQKTYYLSINYKRIIQIIILYSLFNIPIIYMLKIEINFLYKILLKIIITIIFVYILYLLKFLRKNFINQIKKLIINLLNNEKNY